MLNVILAELPPGNPITFTGIDNIFSNFLSFLVGLSGVVMVIALVITGMLMIWSRGEEASFKKGREMLKTTVIGSAVILGGSLILNIITSVVSGSFTFGPAIGIIGTLADFIMGLAGVMMVTFIVISGIMMASSGDDAAKFKKARQMLVNTLWGSLVILGSGVILNTVYALITGEFFCRVWVPVLHICLWS